MTGERCPPDYIPIPIDNDGVGVVLTIIADVRWGYGIDKIQGTMGLLQL
jgi:hypothetical protein